MSVFLKGRTWLAGLIASLAAVVFLLFVAPILGLPAIDIISQAQHQLGSHAPLWGGVLAVAMYGVVNAAAFQWLFNYLPGTGWVRGVAFGFISGYVALAVLPVILQAIGRSLALSVSANIHWGVTLDHFAVLTMIGYLAMGTVLALQLKPDIIPDTK